MASSIVRTVDVARPLREVYDAWTRLEDLAGVMPGVASVRQLDERTTSWVVVIAKERREFAAVVTEQRPDIRIAWKGVGTPPHAGVVTFHRLDASTTRITAQIDWEPVGTFDRLGSALGLVDRQVAKALDGFREAVEARTVPAEGWRGTIEPSDDDLPESVAAAARRSDEEAARRARVQRIGVDAAPGSGADDRGRTATSPTELPGKGWLASAKRAAKQLKDDNVQILAAAVAFYLFLSFIPALGAAVSLYGLIADPADVASQVESVSSGLPPAAAELVVEQAREAAAAETSALGIGLVVGVATALFSASKGTQALVKALNIAYDEEEGRGFLQLRLVSLAMTVGIIVVGLGATAALVVVGNLVEGIGGGAVIGALRWPLLGLVLVLVLAALYRWSPDRDPARWRWTTPGAVVAAVLVAVGSLGLSLYTTNVGAEATSGFLGAVGVLLLWLFVCAYAVLFGAELDSELEHQTAEDTTKGPAAPMGTRDAVKADTVAS